MKMTDIIPDTYRLSDDELKRGVTTAERRVQRSGDVKQYDVALGLYDELKAEQKRRHEA